MTTICFKDGILAADRQATHHDSAFFAVTKIHRINGCLVGGAGSADVYQSMINWFQEGAKDEDFPSIQSETNDATMVVISPDGRVMVYDRTPHPVIIENEFFALGSGRDFALAAMHLGCSAEEAVKVASMFDTNSGNGVTVLKLNGDQG